MEVQRLQSGKEIVSYQIQLYTICKILPHET